MSIQGKKIVGSSSKQRSANSKEDTLEKVRVMRERQSKWMRQREEAKSSGRDKPIKSANSVESFGSKSRESFNSSRKASASDFDSAGRDAMQSPRRKPLYEPPKRDRSNMITWSGSADNTGKAKRPPSASRSQHERETSSRSTKLDSSRSNKSETGKGKPYEPLKYGGSAKPSADVVASARVLYNKLEPIQRNNENTESRANYGDDDESGDDSVDESEMKKQNGLYKLDEQRGISEKGIDASMIDALAETVAQRLKTTMQPNNRQSAPPHNQQELDAEDMSTHLCPLCQTLMSGSRHTPVALIPCGHTFCQMCTRDCRKCPDCQMRVKATAVNTVMQQIIGDFKAQKEKERLAKLEEQTRKYIDEYQSLSLRSRALADEAESILNNMEDTTEQIFQEKKVVKKLQVDEEEIKHRISELQDQLAKNKSKLSETQERCEKLEIRYDEEKQRLSLVEDTIKTITQSKERVKMMVNNFAPNLNLENFD
ncbi:uncharacterized protein LOC5517192 [Nematostella vectensis]|uniref:uncharacterized protein LOC5517192 n=1 Tax=Nematostella vectensis TaxID=45351 RepID=UPI002077954F|nr:uncharacterized protein LOC5517192 [Nematostella vectensis]